MAKLDPIELATRREKVVGVIIVIVSVVVHSSLIFGHFLKIFPERQQEERLIIVRRIPDITSLEEPAPGAPSKKVFQGEKPAQEKSKPPREEKPKPPEEKPGQPPPKPPEPQKPPEEKPKKENTVSIVTDLDEARFQLQGPVSFKGAGTYWEKKGLPAGDYTVIFGAVEGYRTPESQSGALSEGGSLSFVGRYTKMTQVNVNINVPQAKFKIIRPDGGILDLGQNRQAFFRDLPLGVYTVVFDDLPGFATPSAQSKSLEPGGQLAFSAFYSPLGTGRGRGFGGTGSGAGVGTPKKGAAVAARSQGPVLDRRIKMNVTSYPPTDIEESYTPVAYPELVIRKSDYQQGWCQVYLRLNIGSEGDIIRIIVERPGSDERERFVPLIKAVEDTVRNWQFEAKQAEVHVDVRFSVER